MLVCALALGLVMALSPPAHAALQADYRFDGTLTASGGGAPVMEHIGDVPNAFRTETVLGEPRKVLAFACNSGVKGGTAGVIDAEEYSVAVLFRMQSLQSWKRIIDFNDGEGDDGLYVFNGRLNFYPVITSDEIVFAPDTYAQVVLTRTAGGQVTGYVNGVEVIAFDDSVSEYARIKADVLRYFRDNDGGGGPTTEAAAGAVSRIRLFDHVLTPAAVAGLDQTPPPVVDSDDMGAPGCDVSDPSLPRFDGDGTGDVRRVAIQMCEFLFDQPGQSQTVILARDDVFADALAGSPLAGDHSCVLYTTGGPDVPIDPETLTEIQRVLPPGGKVRILGGELAVSAQVASQLQQSGFRVERFQGASRVQTAVEIAKTVRRENPGNSDLLLAFAFNFPDAVTGGAYGARTGTPILLTQADDLHPAAQQAISELGVTRTYVLGGTSVIHDATAAKTPNPQRISGSNRMSTATEVATRLWSQVVPQVSEVVVANIDRPDGWALTLAAAPLSARSDAPQVGVGVDRYPPETETYLTGLSPRAETAYLMGNEEFIGPVVAAAVGADLQ